MCRKLTNSLSPTVSPSTAPSTAPTASPSYQAFVASTYAGTGLSIPYTDGARSSATFKSPRKITGDSQGNLYVANYDDATIRKIDVSSGIVSTIAGIVGSSIKNVLAGNGDNGAATSTSLSGPISVCVDGVALYVVDNSNSWIRAVDLTTGIIITLAGGDSVGDSDGIGTSASFTGPYDCAVVIPGTIVVADYGANNVKSIAVNTQVVTTLSSGMPGVTSIWVDSTGMIYAGSGNNVIWARSFSGNGSFSIVAGQSGLSAWTDGTGTNAQFGVIYGLYGSTDGILYITDNASFGVRKMVTTTLVVTTIAGTGSSVSSGNGGSALSASLQNPFGIWQDSEGSIFVAEESGYIIRKFANIAPTAAPSTAPATYAYVSGYSSCSNAAAVSYIVPVDTCTNIVLLATTGSTSNFGVIVSCASSSSTSSWTANLYQLSTNCGTFAGSVTSSGTTCTEITSGYFYTFTNQNVQIPISVCFCTLYSSLLLLMLCVIVFL